MRLYIFLRAALRLFTHMICRYRVYGLERVPENGPLLIVANHLSWFDPILLGVALRRRVWFFTKSEIFRWPIVGAACRATGQIPVRRGEGDRAALEKGLAYLKEGKALGIFPEGTVERKMVMIPALTGGAMLAMRSGTTVLPIAHTGTRKILRSPRWWFPRVTITIGEPYVPVVPTGMSRKAGLQRVTDEMVFRIARMLPPENRGVYGDLERLKGEEVRGEGDRKGPRSTPTPLPPLQ